MSHEELLGRIKNLNVSLVEDMSSDTLAMLTERFSETLVRAIMCRTQDNHTQKKIFTKIKSSYKSWKKATNVMWGTMPNMEVYPDWMDKMQLDVECGMIITEDGRIPAPKSPTAKIPTALDTLGTGVLFQEIYGKTHPASTDNPPIKEIVYNISTKKPAKTQETAQLQARIKELEAENASLRKQLEDYQSEDPAEEIEWHDKVRLELLLRLLENSGTDMENVRKIRVAEVMRSVTNLPISTCKNYCSNRILSTSTHEEEILKLNSKLQAIGISILL